MFAGLSVLGDTGLEFTGARPDDQDGAVSLGSARDHVLDEIAVTGGIDDGDLVLRGLELPQGNVDGDTTLTLRLELVEHPGVLEGALAEFVGFLHDVSEIRRKTRGYREHYLFELFDRTRVNTTALVDQVAGSGGLAGIDVADNDDVDVSLLFLTEHRVSK